MKKSIFALLCLAPALLFAAPATATAAADITPLITTHEYRLTIGRNTSIYKFHPDRTWEESYKGDVKTGQWKQTGPGAFTIGGFSFVLEDNGAALRRSCGKTWRRAAPLASATAAPDIAPAITGAEYRLAIGPNTSAYTFYADHTWEENYRGAVKGGIWRQTGPGALTIGGFSFTVVPETTGAGVAAALRRSDNKTWRRAPAAAAVSPAAASSFSTPAAAPAANASAAPDLIPAAPGHATPNYWCTWWSQADGRRDPALRAARAAALANAPAFDGDQGDPAQRDGLNHQLVFAPGGWAHDYPDARADLHLVLDDGWDVPYGLDSAKSRAPFGSCIPDPARWPADPAATPAQRLRALNDAAKAAGWRGLGLWIAVQKQGETGAPASPAYDPVDSPHAPPPPPRPPPPPPVTPPRRPPRHRGPPPR
ncbi:MAG: hypothetical protein LBC18_03745, partial [Opitutaceae bacterium]|nr:hypothetical protein [Opitutaceae bacterium]